MSAKTIYLHEHRLPIPDECLELIAGSEQRAIVGGRPALFLVCATLIPEKRRQ